MMSGTHRSGLRSVNTRQTAELNRQLERLLTQRVYQSPELVEERNPLRIKINSSSNG